MTTTNIQNRMTQHRSKLDDDKKSKFDNDDKEKTIRSLRAHTGQLCASPWAGPRDSKAEKKTRLSNKFIWKKLKYYLCSVVVSQVFNILRGCVIMVMPSLKNIRSTFPPKILNFQVVRDCTWLFPPHPWLCSTLKSRPGSLKMTIIILPDTRIVFLWCKKVLIFLFCFKEFVWVPWYEDREHI